MGEAGPLPDTCRPEQSRLAVQSKGPQEHPPRMHSLVSDERLRRRLFVGVEWSALHTSNPRLHRQS